MNTADVFWSITKLTRYSIIITRYLYRKRLLSGVKMQVDIINRANVSKGRFFVSILFVACASLSAQNHVKHIAPLLRFNINEANAVFDSLLQANVSEHSFYFTYLSYSYTLSCLNNFNQNNYQRFLNQEKNLLERISNSRISNVQVRYQQLDVFLHIFSMAILANDYWNAMHYLFLYYRGYLALSNKNHSVSLKKHAVILSLLYQKLSIQYRTLAFILPGKLMLENPLQVLNNYTTEVKGTAKYTEAKALQYLVKGAYFNNYQFQPASALNNTPVFIFLRIRNNVQHNKSKRAINLFKTLAESDKARWHLFNYYMGVACIQVLDASAIHYLNDYQNVKTISLFKNETKRYIAWYQLLNNNTSTTTNGLTINAEFVYTENTISLLTSRLLFDGGQYVQALNELKKTVLSELKPEQKVEYYYRKGVILKQLNSLEPASAAFEKALCFAFTGMYYQPRACLLLAEVYITLNDLPTARIYLHQGLEFSGYHYENEIRYTLKNLMSEFSD